MMRAPFIIASLIGTLAMHSQAVAQVEVAQDVISRIEAEGYTIVDVKRSWLGRIVITANDADAQREVVLNRRSGEVLRDQRYPRNGGTGDASEQSRQPNSDGARRGGGDGRRDSGRGGGDGRDGGGRGGGRSGG